jgi:hypothetical protein
VSNWVVPARFPNTWPEGSPSRGRWFPGVKQQSKTQVCEATLTEAKQSKAEQIAAKASNDKLS